MFTIVLRDCTLVLSLISLTGTCLGLPWTVPSSPVVPYSPHILITNRERLVRTGKGNSRDNLGKSMTDLSNY